MNLIIIYLGVFETVFSYLYLIISANSFDTMRFDIKHAVSLESIFMQ